MTQTIVEKMYPQETFIKKIEELGFTFEDYGYSGENDEFGMQDYFFSFPFVEFDDDEEEEDELQGDMKLIIEIEGKRVSFDMRVKYGTISEEQRLLISEIIHELAKTTPAHMEKITFHGFLVKDLAFYKETINNRNKEKLIEIAKNLTFREKNSYYDLFIQGMDGKIFANILIDMYEGFETHPLEKPIEYTTEIGFENSRSLTTESQLYIAKYFSTQY